MAGPALSYCAEQVRRFDNDRFLCNLFAPEAAREGLWSIYAFNVELARIRESVTQPLLGHIRLRWWMDALDAIYSGRPPRHEVAMALGKTVHRFGLERRHLDRIISGRAADLEDTAPASFDALIDYADATSAAVSEAAIQVLGIIGEETREAAREVGIGWALVGIVRAVPFHARARRIYLPTDLNRLAGLDAFQMFEKGATAGVREVVEELLGCAMGYLGRARARRGRVASSALPVLLPATLADVHLARLRRADFNPFHPDVQAPSALRPIRLLIARLRLRY